MLHRFVWFFLGWGLLATQWAAGQSATALTQARQADRQAERHAGLREFDRPTLPLYLHALRLAERARLDTLLARQAYYAGRTYYNLARLDSALTLLQLSWQASRRAQDLAQHISTGNFLALTYGGQGRPDSVKAMHRRLEALYPQTRPRTDARSRLDNVLASRYQDDGQYTRALEYRLAQLAYARQTHDTVSLSVTLTNIGELFYLQSQYRQAVRYKLEGLEWATRTAAMRSTLPQLHGLLGKVYVELNSLDSARLHYETSLRQMQAEASEPDGAAYVQAELSKVLSKQGNLTLARRHVQQALAAVATSQDLDTRAIVNFYAGDLELQTRNYTAARRHLRQAYDLARQVQNKDRYEAITRLLAEAEAGTGHYAEAYRLRSYSAALLDSAHIGEGQRAMAAMEARYQNQDKQRQIRLLESEGRRRAAEAAQQRQATYWALTGVAGLLVVVGLIGYLLRQRQRTAALLARQNVRLAELNQVKARFFANISHEFRTPLTLILGPAEQLADDPPTDPAQVRRQGRLVVRHARKLLRLINQLLDLSKLEAGALQLNAVPADAALFARRLLASFSSLADTQGVALRLHTPGGSVPLVFDPEKLEDALSNLLANALRFTPRGGEVTLTVTQEPAGPAAPHGAVRFGVRDTGPGVSPEVQPHLFDRFYQADSADSTGTGLGLALVKELMELHGGTVSVQSAPGQGATFTLRLPRQEPPAPNEAAETAIAPVTPATAPATQAPTLAQATAETAPGPFGSSSMPAAPVETAAPPVPALRSGANGRHPETATPAPAGEVPEPDGEADVVLVIEDHPDVREFIRETLAPAGYRVLEAPDGAAGVALARETVPDLILSDVMMPPGPDGYQVCEQLKTDPATSHIPVVLLTARADPRDKLQGLETGADAYLAKPFNPRELRAQVRNLLALRRRLQARFAPLPAEPQPTNSPSGEVLETGAAAPTEAPAPGSLPHAAPLLSPLERHAAAVAALPSLDQAFLRRVEQAVETHLDDGEFSVEALSQEVALSRAQLHRKLKALTGQAPSDFIRATRLLRAHALLQAQIGTVAEVAYQVGFNSPAHFSTSFSRQFGYAPSEVKGLTV